MLCTIAAAFADDQKRDPEAIGQRKVDSGINFYSLEKEIALGKQLAIEVERQAKLLDDPITCEYINRLTQNLVRNSDVKFPVTIKVIDDDVVNAFTLPGGHLFVNTGLIRLSESEAELASAISHELGHVAARHYVRQVSQRRYSQRIHHPADFPGRNSRPPAARGSVQHRGAGRDMFKFSRDFETEADMLGIQYLYKTGYDPNAAIDMFERIEATERKHPGAVSQLFNTHPLTSDRIAKTQQNIDKTLPARPEYVVNTSEYEDVRARLVSLQSMRKVNEKSAPTLLKNPADSKDDRPTPEAARSRNRTRVTPGFLK